MKNRVVDGGCSVIKRLNDEAEPCQVCVVAAEDERELGINPDTPDANILHSPKGHKGWDIINSDWLESSVRLLWEPLRWQLTPMHRHCTHQ